MLTLPFTWHISIIYNFPSESNFDKKNFFAMKCGSDHTPPTPQFSFPVYLIESFQFIQLVKFRDKYFYREQFLSINNYCVPDGQRKE